MDLSIQTLVFPLINRYSRQFFEIDYYGVTVRYLYDSGAKMPVWCTGRNKFLQAFPDAAKMNEHCSISGFGKGIEQADVYVIPDFVISDGNSQYEIERLVVAMLMKPHIGCDFLISETMFSKIDSFSYRRKKRQLHLVGENRPYQCTTRKNGDRILDISVWTQAET